MWNMDVISLLLLHACLSKKPPKLLWTVSVFHRVFHLVSCRFGVWERSLAILLFGNAEHPDRVSRAAFRRSSHVRALPLMQPA